MKRIVAVPAAATCGVLPAGLLPLASAGKADEEPIYEAHFVVSGLGQIIAALANLAGADGGCHAEVGAAHRKGLRCPLPLEELNVETMRHLCRYGTGTSDVPGLSPFGQSEGGALHLFLSSCSQYRRFLLQYSARMCTLRNLCDESSDAMCGLSWLLTPDLRNTALSPSCHDCKWSPNF
jgi:L-serine deaminase